MNRKSLAAALFAVPVLIFSINCGGKSSDSPTTQVAVDTAYFVGLTGLYSSQLSASGTDNLIGNVKLADGSTVFLSDLATAPDGSLYASGGLFSGLYSQLYSINKTTAVATPIGVNTLSYCNSLTFDSHGALFGASYHTNSLYSIDKVSGVATLIGPFGSGFMPSGDIAFDGSGTLWGSVQGIGDSKDTLVTISTTTGTASAKFTGMPFNIYGLTFVKGTLYAACNFDNGLYSIDTTTGNATLIRKFTFGPYGAGIANTENNTNN